MSSIGPSDISPILSQILGYAGSTRPPVSKAILAYQTKQLFLRDDEEARYWQEQFIVYSTYKEVVYDPFERDMKLSTFLQGRQLPPSLRARTLSKALVQGHCVSEQDLSFIDCLKGSSENVPLVTQFVCASLRRQTKPISRVLRELLSHNPFRSSSIRAIGEFALFANSIEHEQILAFIEMRLKGRRKRAVETTLVIATQCVRFCSPDIAKRYVTKILNHQGYLWSDVTLMDAFLQSAVTLLEHGEIKSVVQAILKQMISHGKDYKSIETLLQHLNAEHQRDTLNEIAAEILKGLSSTVKDSKAYFRLLALCVKRDTITYQPLKDVLEGYHPVVQLSLLYYWMVGMCSAECVAFYPLLKKHVTCENEVQVAWLAKCLNEIFKRPDALLDEVLTPACLAMNTHNNKSVRPIVKQAWLQLLKRQGVTVDSERLYASSLDFSINPRMSVAALMTLDFGPNQELRLAARAQMLKALDDNATQNQILHRITVFSRWLMLNKDREVFERLLSLVVGPNSEALFLTIQLGSLEKLIPYLDDAQVSSLHSQLLGVLAYTTRNHKNMDDSLVTRVQEAIYHIVKFSLLPRLSAAQRQELEIVLWQQFVNAKFVSSSARCLQYIWARYRPQVIDKLESDFSKGRLFTKKSQALGLGTIPEQRRSLLLNLMVYALPFCSQSFLIRFKFSLNDFKTKPFECKVGSYYWSTPEVFSVLRPTMYQNYYALPSSFRHGAFDYATLSETCEGSLVFQFAGLRISPNQNSRADTNALDKTQCRSRKQNRAG